MFANIEVVFTKFILHDDWNTGRKCLCPEHVEFTSFPFPIDIRRFLRIVLNYVSSLNLLVKNASHENSEEEHADNDEGRDHEGDDVFLRR